MIRRKKTFRILIVMCCMALGFVLTFAGAESVQSQSGKQTMSLFSYLEIGEDYSDSAWLQKMADTTVAAAVFYSNVYDVNIHVYRIARSWGEGNPPVFMGTYAISAGELSRLYADLTNEGLITELKGQRDNNRLNISDMNLMMDTIQADPAENKMLLVFSNVSQEAWIGDSEVYTAWEKSKCPIGLFGYGTLNTPESVFQDSKRFVLDQAADVPAAQIAASMIENIAGDRVFLSKIDEDWKAAADGFRMNRRIVSTAKLDTGYNLYSTDGLTIFNPPDDMNLGFDSLGDAWMQYDSFVTGTLSTNARWEKNQEIVVQLEIRNQSNRVIEVLDGWSANAELLDATGKRLQLTQLNAENGQFTGQFSPLQTEGEYTIHATASYDRLGVSAEIETVQFNLDNKAPKSEQTNREEIQVWDWIQRYKVKSVLLTDFFSDDSDVGKLSFQINPVSVPGISIDGSYLKINAEQLENPETEVHITATDQEGKSSENFASFQVIRYSLMDIWTLEAELVSEEPPGGYEKNDIITVHASIKKSEVALPDDAEEDGWQVTVLSDEQMSVCQMTVEEEAYTGTFSLDKKGEYHLSAVASLGDWKLGPVTVGEIRITNVAPTWVGEMPENIVLWKNSPVDLDQSGSTLYKLDTLFSDDAARPLSFTVQTMPKTEGILINENRLEIDPDQMTAGSYSMEITAQDDENMSKSHTVQLECHDVLALLKQEDMFSAQVNIQQEEPFYKDSPMTARMEVTCGVEIKEYAQQLSDESLALFRKNFSASFAGIDGIESEPAELTFEADGKITVSKEIPVPRLADNYTINGILSIKNREDDITGSVSFAIENRTPGLTQFKEGSTTLLIPGPLFLNQDMKTERYDIPVEQMIEAEVLDVLSIRFQGMNNGHFVQQEDGSWLYTDAEEPASDGTVIQWIYGETFPGLKIQAVHHGQYQMTMIVEDDDGASAEADIILKTEFKDEKMLLMIAIGVAALIVLLILIIVIWQLTKPSYREDDILHLETNGVKHEVHVEDWKKKGITLRELLIYSGAPLMGDVNMKVCDKIFFMPGRKRKNILCTVKNEAADNALQVWLYNTAQHDKKVKVPFGEELEIRFEQGASIRVS